ncbi:MAG: HEAT repeat domain-containing protein [Cyanobacteria bacterium J06643_5]
MRKQLFESVIATSLISLSILPLTASRTWGTDTSSKQQRKSVIVATTNQSSIARLIENLEQKYIDVDSSSARNASKELVSIGKPAVPQLIEGFKRNRSLLTFEIVETLSQIAQKDASVAQILIDNLGNNNSQIRSGAIFALSDSPSKFKTQLKKAARDRNPRVRSGAMLALSNNKVSKFALPIFRAALNDSNSTVRNIAEAFLASHDKNPARITPALKNGLKNNDSLIRVIYAQMLANNDSQVVYATPVLMEELTNKDAIIRSLAIQPLLEISKTNPQVLPVIIKAINDNDSGVQMMAIAEMHNFRNQSKAIVPALIRATNNRNKIVRASAILELKKLGSQARAATPQLITMLRNKRESDGIRINAAAALEKIDSLALIPVLVNSLSERRFGVLSFNLLTNVASQIDKDKNSYSRTELARAIFGFETALKIIENSEDNFSQDRIKSLQKSVAVLKSSRR